MFYHCCRVQVVVKVAQLRVPL